MRNLYNILTIIANFHLKIFAPFNKKISLGVKGRNTTYTHLNDLIKPEDKTLWFHCASLGEYEQGLPVFEGVKMMFSDHKIVLTFFSPSGYEIKKNTPLANAVVYLPLDTKKNAEKFLDLIHPSLVIFVKYEIWPNYLSEIKRLNIPSILISAVFRKEQPYFKSHSKWMLKSLEAFDHFFVQNEASKTLIESYGFNNVSVSGDTRFDRVSQQLDMNNVLNFIETFKSKNLCLVAGSTWPEDEKILIDYINSTTNDLKFIIAPHNIKKSQIEHLRSDLKDNVILYSEKESKDLSHAKILILDTIGLLSKVYNYADIAYVGGALGQTGLHNTLEPAVFGVPIIIGPNYQNFPEAIDMITQGGMLVVDNANSFKKTVDKLASNREELILKGEKNAEYVKKNRGAVIQILDYLRKYKQKTGRS
ncbi:MAG: 3-deoxy-D-manno-octulosonic acid transferase [Flavobacteriaceae bacterium]|nr:MAG: 3-deoxy-D-manno-octulosonic acid transferase [Flavobacteriaceae bacterium]